MQTRNKYKTCVIKVYFKNQLRLDSPLLDWDGTVDAKVDGNKDSEYWDLSLKRRLKSPVLHLFYGSILEFQMRANCLSRACGMIVKPTSDSEEFRSWIHWGINCPCCCHKSHSVWMLITVTTEKIPMRPFCLWILCAARRCRTPSVALLLTLNPHPFQTAGSFKPLCSISVMIKLHGQGSRKKQYWHKVRE